MKSFFTATLVTLRAADSWRLHGAAAQRMTRVYMATASALILFALLVLSQTIMARPLAAAAVCTVALGLALYCWRLSAQGRYLTAVHAFGPGLWVLIMVPFLVFGRNPAFCALILFSVIPLYAAVAGVFAAALYVLSFFVAVIAFIVALRWGFDPPVYFPLGMPVQLAVAGLGAMASAFPMLSVLNGIQTEHQRAEHELLERKSAESALEALTRNLSAQLTESELMLRSSIDAIGEAFVIYDAEDRLSYCNEEYRQKYKISAPLIEPGQTFEDIIRYGAYHGQYAEAIGREEAWIRERMDTHRQGDTALIQKLNDGRWLKILERKTPNGHTVGFRVDVTELYRAKEAAEAASRAKGQFLATMSHEIRTPMNAMLGMAQVLLDPDLPYQERQETAQIILRSGQNMLALLNDMLDFSKIEAGKLELHNAEFAPADLIQDVVRFFMPSAHLKQLSMHAHQHQGMGQRYLADFVRTRQMLSNLVGNAVKFTAQGRVDVEVREVVREGQSAVLEFSVTDTGPGITSAQIQQLFQPFTQLDGSATRKYSGSGLGLSIVKTLAELMGGTAGVESEPGRGSRFWFRIRAGVLQDAQSIAQMQNLSPMAASSKDSTIPQLRGHVLVCDDDPIHRKVIDAILNKLGLTYVLVENGQAGLERVQAGEHFDLVIMDVNMPVLDGVQATKEIRQWQHHHGAARVTIVAISADVFDEDRKRCSDAGMDDFIAKPIYFQSLASVLAHWLPVRAQAMPASAPVSAQGQKPAVPLETLKAMVVDLLPYLASQSFDAFGRFKLLKEAAAHSPWEGTLKEADALLRTMQFSEVMERLKTLVSSQQGRDTT